MPARTSLLLGLLLALTASLVPTGRPADAVTLLPQTLSGTLLGSDGRAVGALIGIDLHDASGRQITKDGCVESRLCPVDGYAMNLRVNPDLGAEGSTDTRAWDTRWSVQVPANTASVYLEVYPQASGFGGTDESRYGSTMRHAVAVPTRGPVHLRLPLDRCDLGGTTGTIVGTATKGGRRVSVRRVVGWSLAADNNVGRPILGWNIEPPGPNGTFRLPNLASGQKYQVWVTTTAGLKKTFGVPVRPCATTRLDLRF
ncbi:MAG: hypothetical protein JWM64_2901 [Frankiales bacterium]|nr:hypothetical protein [Frankiales bacterium]